MDNRISNSPRPTVNTAYVPSASNAYAANNATLNTADATSFSANAAPASMQDVAAAISELEARIAELESRVNEFHPPSPNGAEVPANNAPAINVAPPAAPPVAPPVSPVNNAASNNPSANGPVLPPGVTLPAYPGAAAPSATANAPAANTTATPAPSAAQGPEVRSQIQRILAGLKEMQATIQKRIAQLEVMLRGTAADPQAEAQRNDLEKQAAGLEAVSHVLRQAKLTNLTPEEEQVVRPALERVHEIGRLIGQGDSPDQYAAELYALKYTLADPANAGQHRAVTQGAQVVGLINSRKAELEGRLAQLQAAQDAGRLDAAGAQEKAAAEAQIKGLVNIEKALDGAKLTRLDPQAEARALQAIDRLGDLAEAVGSGQVDPASIEDEVFRLGQSLKSPNGQVQTQAVDAGATVIKQIGDAKAAIHERLRAIDDEIIGGAAPEKYAGERARLMERAEALNELSGVVSGVRMEQSTPQARRAVQEGLKSATEITGALAQGESPDKYRAEIFVLKQTFQEPLPSRENPAVQSGAATLQLIGKAAARNMKEQEAIASQISRGADPRKFDQQSAKLHRQAEDLELIRHTIEGADLGGLSPEQEAQGAKVIDQMRDIAMKVANGDDFGKYQRQFEALAKSLADLHHWQPAAQGPKPTPKPAPTPAPTPAPASEDKGLEPGAMYKVQAGDYLTKIAREKLGDPNRFKDIIELNKDKYPSLEKNPDLIYPGWMLVLPKA